MSDEFEAPLGTIKRRLHVARKRLAEELEAPVAV
jgi:RNA polymerase sigma-70 factor (ECF subfamily)